MVLPSTIRFSTLSRMLLSFSLVVLVVITFCLLLTIEIFTMYQELQFEPHPTVKQSKCQPDDINKTSALLKFSTFLQKENARLNGRVRMCDQLKMRQQKEKQSGQTASDVPQTEVIIDREFFDYLANHLRDTPYPGVDDYTRYTVARLGLAPLVGVEQLIPEFGPVINDVLSFKYPIVVPPCQDHAITGGRTVFVVINSAAGNFRKRTIIRQTWKNHLNDVHQEGLLGVGGFAFVLGLTEDQETQNQIEKEAKTYGDIIQIGILDFYRNMSLKVAGLFNWLYKYCAKVDFVVKLDDDVYVNVRNLAHFVQTCNHPDLSMFGSASPTPADFFTHRDGKWNISFEEWPWHHYPQYYLGPAVLMPGVTILPLLAAIQTTPMMPFDDVYYTGVCREKAGIRLYNSSRSNSVLTLDMPLVPKACHLRRFIAWMTDFETHMNNSHVAVNNFYRNATQCVITNSKGTRSFDHSQPADFQFS